MQRFIIAILAVISATDAFLFPDLKQRSGRTVPYGVAAIEEEPYVNPNGSGYVQDLLEQISRSSGFEQGDKPLPLEVVPVKVWKQLLERARAAKSESGDIDERRSIANSAYRSTLLSGRYPYGKPLGRSRRAASSLTHEHRLDD